MGLFGKKKKFIDLSEGYRSSARKVSRESKSEPENSALGFLGDMANSSDSTSTSDNVSWDNDSSSETVGEYHNKKQKFAKRLLDMTNKIEDLSNQIYHLKQRIELLEKRMKVRYE